MTIGEILNWIKNYKINTHAIASVLAGLPILYAENAQFHDAVTAAWGHVPNALRGLIVAAVPLWALYRNSQKGGIISSTEPTITRTETVPSPEAAKAVQAEVSASLKQ
jgi:hypothetical protein